MPLTLILYCMLAFVWCINFFTVFFTDNPLFSYIFLGLTLILSFLTTLGIRAVIEPEPRNVSVPVTHLEPAYTTWQLFGYFLFLITALVFYRHALITFDTLHASLGNQIMSFIMWVLIGFALPIYIANRYYNRNMQTEKEMAV